MLLFALLYFFHTVVAYFPMSRKMHLKAMAVPNSKIKQVQMSLLSKKITLFNDPMIDDYNEKIRDTPLDFENDENTMKAIKNINTPLLIRVPASRDLYQELMLHD